MNTSVNVTRAKSTHATQLNIHFLRDRANRLAAFEEVNEHADDIGLAVMHTN